MSKAEAIQQMQQGHKVSHINFSDDEFIYLKNGEIHDEQNLNINSEFWSIRATPEWNSGWFLFQ